MCACCVVQHHLQEEVPADQEGHQAAGAEHPAGAVSCRHAAPRSVRGWGGGRRCDKLPNPVPPSSLLRPSVLRLTSASRACSTCTAKSRSPSSIATSSVPTSSSRISGMCRPFPRSVCASHGAVPVVHGHRTDAAGVCLARHACGRLRVAFAFVLHESSHDGTIKIGDLGLATTSGCSVMGTCALCGAEGGVDGLGLNSAQYSPPLLACPLWHHQFTPCAG
jgi:hypothetical protein